MGGTDGSILTTSEASLPQELEHFLEQASSQPLRKLYTGGSFAIIAPLLDTMTLRPTELSSRYSKASTGVYLPATAGAEALASRIQFESLFPITNEPYKR